MVRTLLIRGMLAGVAAGLAACIFAWIFGEPQIALAIGFEQHAHAMAGDAAEPEIVSRAMQRTLGLLTAALVYGSAIGGIFALVFAYAYARIGRFSPRTSAALLAGLGFGALILVPQIKYPANPPSIGMPETIGERTALYFLMIALSVIAATAAVSTGRQLAQRLGGWNSALLAIAAYLVVGAATMAILPAIDEVPSGFSATTLWNFRLAALGTQIVLWTTLGLVFGALTERQLAASAYRTVPDDAPPRLRP
jgi:hypothetical protein